MMFFCFFNIFHHWEHPASKKSCGGGIFRAGACDQFLKEKRKQHFDFPFEKDPFKISLIEFV